MFDPQRGALGGSQMYGNSAGSFLYGNNNGTNNFILGNGVKVCSMCPELCIGDMLADGFNMQSSVFYYYPEWYCGGMLIDSLNVTGALPDYSEWANFSGVSLEGGLGGESLCSVKAYA